MSSFSDIAYVPRAMSNMFMGDISFDTNIFRLLCEVYENDPSSFIESSDYAYMNTKVKDFRNGEIIYAWFTINRNATATQKWYNSDFKTESELEELGILNNNNSDKINKQIIPEEEGIKDTIEKHEEKKNSSSIHVVKKLQKAFIEKFPIEQELNTTSLRINLIPDPDSIKWIYSDNIAMDCAICTLSIEPDWIHFDDLEKHGLVEFWDYAHNHDNRCILVLQNLNQTLIKSALQPLMDVLENNRPQLPFSSYRGCPKNLSIIGTLLPFNDPLAVPLDKEFIEKCELFTKDAKFSKELLIELYSKEK